MSFPAIPVPSFLQPAAAASSRQQQPSYKVKNEVLSYTAPESLTAGFCKEDANSSMMVPPTRTLGEEEQCVICCDSMLYSRGYSREYAERGGGGRESREYARESAKQGSSPVNGFVVELRQCGHCFHKSCISASLEQHEPKCPICRTNVQAPAGKSPSGTMSIRIRNDVVCPGFYPPAKTISILYTIPSGRQKSYHNHPGRRFTGTQRVAYLPNNNEGRELLVRMVYAFQHGLTFTVGTSITTGCDNVVTWTSIHHKTRLDGGPYVYGFPDENYISNCHASMDVLGVPSAETIVWGNQPRFWRIPKRSFRASAPPS